MEKGDTPVPEHAPIRKAIYNIEPLAHQRISTLSLVLGLFLCCKI